MRGTTATIIAFAAAALAAVACSPQDERVEQAREEILTRLDFSRAGMRIYRSDTEDRRQGEINQCIANDLSRHAVNAEKIRPEDRDAALFAQALETMTACQSGRAPRNIMPAP